VAAQDITRAGAWFLAVAPALCLAGLVVAAGLAISPSAESDAAGVPTNRHELAVPALRQAVFGLPREPGTHAALLLLAGCATNLPRAEVDRTVEAWAVRLRDLGFVTLHWPHGAEQDCANEAEATTTGRMQTAQAALKYLQSQVFVRPNGVGLVGFFSTGEDAAWRISTGGALDSPRPHDAPLRAAVALYPHCPARRSVQDWQGDMPFLIIAQDAAGHLESPACQIYVSHAAHNGGHVAMLVPPPVRETDGLQGSSKRWPLIGEVPRAAPASDPARNLWAIRSMAVFFARQFETATP
jgi:dienelactone hydrolase